MRKRVHQKRTHTIFHNSDYSQMILSIFLIFKLLLFVSVTFVTLVKITRSRFSSGGTRWALTGSSRARVFRGACLALTSAWTETVSYVTAEGKARALMRARATEHRHSAELSSRGRCLREENKQTYGQTNNATFTRSWRVLFPLALCFLFILLNSTRNSTDSQSTFKFYKYNRRIKY